MLQINRGGGLMQAYCVKCHAKRELRSIKSITPKNGRPAIQGVCPVCGTRVYRIVKSRDTIATVVVRAVNKSWLADVPPDKVFWCHDGRVLKNLGELGAALREMAEETFRYHLAGDRNDFSKWVQEVVGDDELSAGLRKAGTRARAAETVAARVSWLKSQMGRR
jgi:hypothetical protein